LEEHVGTSERRWFARVA